jgi:hypothetical protein
MLRSPIMRISSRHTRITQMHTIRTTTKHHIRHSTTTTSGTTAALLLGGARSRDPMDSATGSRISGLYQIIIPWVRGRALRLEKMSPPAILCPRTDAGRSYQSGNTRQTATLLRQQRTVLVRTRVQECRSRVPLPSNAMSLSIIHLAGLRNCHSPEPPSIQKPLLPQVAKGTSFMFQSQTPLKSQVQHQD